MITLDTSALFALLNRKDPDHGRVKALLLSDPGPYLVPMGILAEIAYLAERRLGLGALEAFLQDLEAGAFSLECGEEDLPRVRALVARYRDLPLGFADAAVVAVSTPPRRKPRWGPQKDLPKPYFGRPMLRNQRAAT